MANTPGQVNNQCIDPSDINNFFDFGDAVLQSPATTSATSRTISRPESSLAISNNNALSPLDQAEEHLVFNGPSHEYGSHKQQTGIPVGALAALGQSSSQGYDAYGMGMGEMALGNDTTMAWNGYATGFDVDMDFDVPNQMPAMFYAPGTMNVNTSMSSDDFSIDPNALQDAPAPAPQRLYPGAHQQQALARQQAQAHAVRQQQLMHQAMQRQKQATPTQARPAPVQTQHRPSASTQQKAKSPSHTEPHVEESISRILQQMRQNSTVSSADDDDEPSNSLPHIQRAKKDEEEMDEDERLLASEEGKKLSSKERRQLRNKVSARAFRSRRKEYISQLEGELATKVNELHDAKTQNRALNEENARYRALIENLLRHPAFVPYLNDISEDPAVTAPPPKQQSATPTPMPSTTPVDVKPLPSLQVPVTHMQNPQVNFAMIPETPLDLSALNLNTGLWALPPAPLMNFQQPRVFSVLELPEGPAPEAVLSPKESESSLPPVFEETKFGASEDELPAPALHSSNEPVEAAPVELTAEEKANPSFALFLEADRSAAAPSSDELRAALNLLPTIPAEKPESQFELTVMATEIDDAVLRMKLEKFEAKMDKHFSKIQSTVAMFDL